jgi:hypothetical protein
MTENIIEVGKDSATREFFLICRRMSGNGPAPLEMLVCRKIFEKRLFYTNILYRTNQKL